MASVIADADNLLSRWPPDQQPKGAVSELACSILIAVLIIGTGVPALAATVGSLGTVILAEGALLDNADASAGTSVFPGDELRTSAGGKLRLRVGAAQIYLLANTSAMFVAASPVVRVKLTQGTAGFSTPALQVVEIDTPQAIIRSNGVSVADSKGAGLSHGEVTIAGPSELVVSSFRGALDIDIDGEVRTITGGHAYRVVTEPLEPSGARIKDVRAISNRRRRQAGFYAVVGGGPAIAGYFAHDDKPESPSSVAKQ